jgi:hypothetical protein
MPAAPKAQPSMKNLLRLVSPSAGSMAIQAIGATSGWPFQPLGIRATVKRSKLLVHQSPAAYGTEPGVQAAKGKKSESYSFFYKKPTEAKNRRPATGQRRRPKTQRRWAWQAERR